MSQAGTFGSGGGGGGNDALVLIQTQHVAGGTNSIQFINLPNIYTTYFLTYNDVSAQPNGTNFTLLFSTDNGATFINSGYQAGENGIFWNNFIGWINANQTTSIFLAGNSQLQFTSSGQMWLYNLQSTVSPFILGTTLQNTAGLQLEGLEQAYNTTTTPVNALKIQCGIIDVIFGTFSLYGLVQ